MKNNQKKKKDPPPPNQKRTENQKLNTFQVIRTDNYPMICILV